MRYSYRFACILLLAFGVFCGLMGERIPVNNQTGWDGKQYADLAIDLSYKWNHKEVDSYLIQRILPSALGYAYFHFILHKKSISREEVVRFFLFLNAMLICLSVWGFYKLSNYLNWSASTEIICFAAFFLHFAHLKQAWYYPVLTDVFAFCLGVWMVYFYITQKHFPLALTLLIGLGVYPLFFVSGLLLFLSPFLPYIIRFLRRRALSILLIASFLGLCIIYLLYPQHVLHAKYIWPVNVTLLPISIPIVVWYIWKITAPVSHHIDLQKEHVSPMWFAGLLLVYITFQWIITTHMPPETVFTARVFLLNVFQQSISNPFAHIVFHASYLGPMVLLLISGKWQYTALSSLHVYVWVYLLLSLGTESRQFINAWPAIVVLYAHTLQQKSFSVAFAWFFSAVSIVFSLCYIPINRPGIFETYQYGNYPEQWYFMHHGPFASQEAYVFSISGCILMGTILYIASRYYHVRISN